MNISTETSDLPKRRAGVARQKRTTAKIDMTPMVDLGFLLIAFFVMTTELNKPASFDLNMPADAKNGISELGQSNALTILLGKNDKVFYYHGSWDDANRLNAIMETSFSQRTGIGKIIREKQAYLAKAKISKEGKDGLMLLIKASDETNYQAVIDALDEAIINAVKRYALIKPEAGEKEFMTTH